MQLVSTAELLNQAEHLLTEAKRRQNIGSSSLYELCYQLALRFGRSLQKLLIRAQYSIDFFAVAGVFFGN